MRDLPALRCAGRVKLGRAGSLLDLGLTGKRDILTHGHLKEKERILRIALSGNRFLSFGRRISRLKLTWQAPETRRKWPGLPARSLPQLAAHRLQTLPHGKQAAYGCSRC